MDFRYPFAAVTPTLDGDVLAVLAGADEEFSGRRLHSLVARGSENGVRNAAERLVEQGVVLRRGAGRAKLYRLNRLHVSAQGIELLAMARGELLVRLQDDFELWQVPPRCAVLFGSAARREAGPHSDLDILVVRPRKVEEDSSVWRNQLSSLERAATGWTGNDARIVELGEDELSQASALLREVLSDGVELAGSLRSIRKAIGEGR
jgi:hypothetical protein